MVLHRVDALDLLLAEIRDPEDREIDFYGKHIRKINTHKRARFNHSEMNSIET